MSMVIAEKKPEKGNTWETRSQSPTECKLLPQLEKGIGELKQNLGKMPFFFFFFAATIIYDKWTTQ